MRPQGLAILALLLFSLVLLGAGGGSAFIQAHGLVQAVEHDLQAGAAELQAGKAALMGDMASRDLGAVEQATSHFRQAKLDFAAARSRVTRSRLLIATASAPLMSSYVAPRVAAIEHLATMGTALANAALGAATVESRIVSSGATDGRGMGGVLTALKPNLPLAQAIARDLATARQAAAAVDETVLPTPQRTQLQKARRTIDEGITGIGQLAGLLSFLDAVLGMGGARTYLVEQLNPAELRPGGGFIGSYSVITADRGHIRLDQSSDASRMPPPQPGKPGYAPPPRILTQFLGTARFAFDDTNFSADFPSNARAGEHLLTSLSGTRFDGVIAIDYYLVAELLKVTGPIPVPGYGQTVSAGDFVSRVMELDLARDPAHKLVLAATAGPLLERLASLPAARLLQLSGVLGQLAAQRHLQVYLNDRGDERVLDRLGWSGTLNPQGAADWMMEVEANVGLSKANYFLKRRYTVALSRSGDLLHHRVQVDLVDPATRTLANHYGCYIRLYVPQAASGLAVQGAQPYKTGLPAPAGQKVLDGVFDITTTTGTMGARRIVFTYDTPWTSDHEGGHLLYWQKQPGTSGDEVSLIWTDGGRSYRAGGELGGDRLIRLGPDGIRFGPAGVAEAGFSSLGI